MINRIHEYLSFEDIRHLAARSDWRAVRIMLFNWLLIIGSLTLAATFKNLLVWGIGLVVLGGRQLGLGILMHDCSHRALFKSRWANDYFGKWLCAAPIGADLEGYRTYHLKHHHRAGTSEDPDRPNYQAYPVSKMSFFRKISRDLTGITGMKTLFILIKMMLGFREYDMAYKEHNARGVDVKIICKNFVFKVGPFILVNAGLFLFCMLVLRASLVFILWPLSYLTTYMLFSRIRNAAEHAVVPDADSLDPLLNTRTTLARWWERLTVAPNFVNFHLEHHLAMHVPPYRLAEAHRLLKSRGAYAASEVCAGYSEVVRKLIAPSPVCNKGQTPFASLR